jgi:hypothetical protein
MMILGCYHAMNERWFQTRNPTVLFITVMHSTLFFSHVLLLFVMRSNLFSAMLQFYHHDDLDIVLFCSFCCFCFSVWQSPRKKWMVVCCSALSSLHCVQLWLLCVFIHACVSHPTENRWIAACHHVLLSHGCSVYKGGHNRATPLPDTMHCKLAAMTTQFSRCTGQWWPHTHNCDEKKIIKETLPALVAWFVYIFK